MRASRTGRIPLLAAVLIAVDLVVWTQVAIIGWPTVAWWTSTWPATIACFFQARHTYHPGFNHIYRIQVEGHTTIVPPGSELYARVSSGPHSGQLIDANVIADQSYRHLSANGWIAPWRTTSGPYWTLNDSLQQTLPVDEQAALMLQIASAYESDLYWKGSDYPDRIKSSRVDHHWYPLAVLHDLMMLPVFIVGLLSAAIWIRATPAQRGKAKLRPDHCPKCQYKIAQMPRCPECGEQLT